MGLLAVFMGIGQYKSEFIPPELKLMFGILLIIYGGYLIYKPKNKIADKKWRLKHPLFIINLELAQKDKNCKLVNAKHKWYKINGLNSGCYYCKKKQLKK